MVSEPYRICIREIVTFCLWNCHCSMNRGPGKEAKLIYLGSENFIFGVYLWSRFILLKRFFPEKFFSHHTKWRRKSLLTKHDSFYSLNYQQSRNPLNKCIQQGMRYKKKVTGTDTKSPKKRLFHTLLRIIERFARCKSIRAVQ